MNPPINGRKDTIFTNKCLTQRQMCEMPEIMLQTMEFHGCVIPVSMDIEGYLQPKNQEVSDVFLGKGIVLARIALKINTLWVNSLRQSMNKRTSVRVS